MSYELRDNIAIITLDDGKANVVGHALLDHLIASLDRAENEGAGAVIIRGREGMFSGGFDLAEFQKGAEAGMAMVQRGFELLIRLYSFPLPTVAAATGHTVAMGAFLVMACDTRIGAQGKFKYTLPETAIGMDLPAILVELTAARIKPHYLTRIALQAEVCDPQQAVDAGFIDELADAGEVLAKAMAVATRLAALPAQSYANNKLFVRAKTLDAMKSDLESRLRNGG